LVAPADRPGQGQVNPSWEKQRSLIMRKIWLALFGTVVCLGLALAVVGCGSSTADNMRGGNMSGDSMTGGKMSGDKMSGDKMGGDKMSGDKMSGDKMDKK
jgi:pentapeptide MXKDX repeat protein